MEPLAVSPSSLWTSNCPGALSGLTCREQWGWSSVGMSDNARIRGCNRSTVYFHPNWSNGTAGVRAQRVLNRGRPSRVYWEIRVTDRIFGTSMMFGIGTEHCKLESSEFVDLIGRDEHGWGLSHKGRLWHNNESIEYTKPFAENKPTTIGMLYDGENGTLTYFKDGDCLGVAFRGLQHVHDTLYPMVCSTAAKTEMTLANMRRDYLNLKDRCREVILQSIDPSKIKMIGLPLSIEKFLTLRSDIDDSSEPSNRSNFLSTNQLILMNRRFDHPNHIPSSNYSHDFFCKPYKMRSFSLTDL